MTTNRSRYDVVVVGGRVAGSATAMLLARLGHDVVLTDRASFPSDTISTHSIARSGVVQLHRWGLLDAVTGSGAPAIRQVTFHALGESVSRTIKHKARVDLVVAPRRYVLDTIIAAAAQRAGADLRTGVTAHGISDAFRDAELLAVAIDQALGAGAEETAALALYQRQRDQALREIFEITCRLAAYPAVPAFVELQKQLSAAIDSEAAALASWPVPGERLLATA